MGAREKAIRSVCEYAYARAGGKDVFSLQADGFSYTGNLFCDVTGSLCQKFVGSKSLTAGESGDCEYRLKGIPLHDPKEHVTIVLPTDNVTIEHAERVLIGKIIAESGWKVSRAADRLGIDRTTLYNKIKKYGIGK